LVKDWSLSNASTEGRKRRFSFVSFFTSGSSLKSLVFQHFIPNQGYYSMLKGTSNNSIWRANESF
jgi:hypothetical protein